MSLCKYKDFFGELRKGVHSIRLFDIAIIDVIETIIGGIIIHKFIIIELLQLHSIKLWMVIVFLFILGIILHRIFCVRTTVDKWLFSD